jgi:hypothetical protein
MPSIKNWWTGEVDWETPAGRLLQKFLATLPADRPAFDEDSPNQYPENRRQITSGLSANDEDSVEGYLFQNPALMFSWHLF